MNLCKRKIKHILICKNIDLHSQFDVKYHYGYVKYDVTDLLDLT